MGVKNDSLKIFQSSTRVFLSLDEVTLSNELIEILAKDCGVSVNDMKKKIKTARAGKFTNHVVFILTKPAMLWNVERNKSIKYINSDAQIEIIEIYNDGFLVAFNDHLGFMYKNSLDLKKKQLSKISKKLE